MTARPHLRPHLRPPVRRSARHSVRHCAVTAGAGAALLSLVLANPAGAAASSALDIVDRETVRASLDSSGKVKDVSLVEQITILGKGSATILDPTSGKGLRNLDGFSTPDVKDGKASYDVTVDGRKDIRTVADYTGRLPVEVKVAYTLNGKDIDPDDLAGKSGEVKVSTTVRNTSSAPTEITYTDTIGNVVSKTVDLVTPLVGQIRTTVPSAFHTVKAPGGALSGDGRGGTVVSYSLVLFPPIGASEQTVSWTATTGDAVVPPAEVSVVPASSQRTEIANAQSSYLAGSKAAGELAVGAGVIDSNLLNLGAGAGQLLDGLTQLAAGAASLQAGLADSAAPGADKIAAGLGSAKDGGDALAGGLAKLDGGARLLSDGLGSAKAGSSKLAVGAGTLSDGLASASAGSEKLLDGSQDLATGAGLTAAGADQLSDGLALISGGLGQLAATSGLPTALAGAVSLKAGVDQILAGLGDAATTGTVLNGMAQLAGGLTQLKTGIATAKGGVDQVKAGVDDGLAPGGSIDQLVAALNSPTPVGGQPTLRYLVNQLALLNTCTTTPTSPTCQTVAGAGLVIDGLVAKIDPLTADSLRGKSKAASDGLGQISAGLGTGTGAAQAGIDQLSAGVTQVTGGLNQIKLGLRSGNPASPGISEGLSALVTGLTAAVAGVTQLSAGATTAAAGSVALADGTAQVAAGAGKLSEEGAAPLAAGLEKLAAGGEQLADGTVSLDEGLGKLSDGSGTLADGTGTASAGATKLSDGLGLLLDGAEQLAPGLDAAADGAGKIAEGLEKTKVGAAKIGDGAGQLSSAGTSTLAKKGAVTQAENAEKAAMLTAMGSKTDDGALPYGAPEGAEGSAVYSFALAGSSTAAKDNTTRGLAALALLGLAGLAGTVVRRRVTG